MPAEVDSTVQQYQTCIDAWNKCMQTCEECLTSCLKEADVQVRIHCINMLHDCADICAMAAQWMSRGSMYAKQFCQLCATICDACAVECAKFKDAHCQNCANYCRQCAEECQCKLNKQVVLRPLFLNFMVLKKGGFLISQLP